MLTFKHSGNFHKTDNFMKKNKSNEYTSILTKYGKKGVTVLSAATPIDSGTTSISWDYIIEQTKSGPVLQWINSNIVDGANVAILIQYGHATINGGYVPGYDYINPAIKSIFDDMADEIWKEINK